MHTARSRTLKVAGYATVVVTTLGLLAVAQGIGGAAKPDPTPGAVNTRRVCATVTVGNARCDAIQVTRVDPARRPGPPTTTSSTTTTTTHGTPTGCTTAHAGYTPCDLQSAYALTVVGWRRPDRRDRRRLRRPERRGRPRGVPRRRTDCRRARPRTAASARSTRTGGTSYPAGNTGWAEEISLDLDMVSAVCPNCHILLVEAIVEQPRRPR